MTSLTAAAPADQTPLSFRLLERDLVPDSVIRMGIRRLLRQRLAEEHCETLEQEQKQLMQFVAQLKASPIALHTREANEQHYELPCEFFSLVLGKHLKYSSCYFKSEVDSLDSAEHEMLALTCERARLADGEKILELGCGWGSLTLFMAERYPNAQITAVSNSRTQKTFIDAAAARRGLHNVQVVTCDMNELSFGPGVRFDRAVSVEMFEHMRNYELLLSRISGWLAPSATLFVHIFTHRTLAYPFEVRDASDWMARYFFTGGIMPSDDLLTYFQRDLRLLNHWQVDGTHYQRTSESWLANMDRNGVRIREILSETYGAHEQRRWWVYWRVFFMSCAELFGYAKGREWLVSHYLFENRGFA
ncbi:MAG TPA: cyclopropane-fatty-acyl-phospholipid synthase family protein [Steroidobacteraceae bacterium]|nr:cyclopropane-fatty-acyl-phospholipid synthase family protein [Steroidobacteraceae bacterium]